MIAAGKFRQRVEVQQDFGPTTTGADTFGANTEDWRTIATVWASVEPLEGREYWQAQQVQSKVSHKIRCRYLAGVTSKMRLRYRSRILNITAVRNLDERRHEMELLCQEKT